jgi:hypothetical protein
VDSVTGSVTVQDDKLTGRTRVMELASLATSAATADQVIVSYTVTTGKTFYLEYYESSARLTTYAATATLFGTVSLEIGTGTKEITKDIFHAGVDGGKIFVFSEPLPITAGTVVRVVCTPSAATAFTWKANFGGYEK